MEPVIKFPIIVTLIVKAVNSTKFLAKGRWISPKNNEESKIPTHIILIEGVSAFFKNFDTDGLTAAIFDGKALTKAMEGGWLEGVFIATIPFAFMGLGYLVHMFQKHKNWLSYLKIATLFIVTFIFDAILAYQIEKKIYDIEKTPDSPVFNIEVAFSKAEFWGIIFAGFVVYIIWGLVFDFIMKEYDNFDKI